MTGMPLSEAIEAAIKAADDNGKAAASWVFDGNTDDSYYRKVLKGIDDGDPAVLDSLDEPSLRGQYTERDLADEIGISCDETTTEDMDKIADAYLQQARDMFWSEVETTARKHLEG